MIHTAIFHNDGNFYIGTSIDELATSLNQTNCFMWVRLESPDDSEINQILSNVFNFHPLAIEDCQSPGYQTSKVDNFNRYIFIIAHTVCFDDLGEELQAKELNLFLGDNYLVTCSLTSGFSPVDSVWKRLENDERLRKYGSGFLCHAVLDALVDNYMPLLEKMDDEIEYVEDIVLENPHPDILQRILTLKHNIMTLRRIIAPQREVMNMLSRDEYPQIQQNIRIYFRDIYDHLVRIQDMSESIRDVVSSVLEIYLNSTSLRLNEIMKALTVVSTIFLPLSFIAGVYGMNFHFMPELNWQNGYLFAWAVFFLIAFGMLFYFKRRGWF